MWTYLVRRILYMIPTLIGITLITFVVIHLAPGDPIEQGQGGMMNQKISAAAIQKMRALYHLDKPLYTQYYYWMKRFMVLDFGTSFLDNRPVLPKILERLPATLWLNVIAFTISYLLAFPLGIFAAAYRNSLFDKASALILFLLYSIPDFWLALILIIQVGVKWDLLPFYGMHGDNAANMTSWEWFKDLIAHSILPVTIFTYGSFTFLSRFIRATMLEALFQDYVRTARAKGVSFAVTVWKHAFRNSLIPVVTLMAALLPSLISGAVIIEYIFSWPGIGRLFFEAILSRDYPVIMANATISATMVLIGILLVDLSYALVDPRITYK